jgi:hypothetical protein
VGLPARGVAPSGAGNDAVPPPTFTSDRQIVFAPHLYSESIAVDGGATTVERGFDNAERAAATYGVPVWSGEWGWFGDPAKNRAKLERYVAQEDARGLGGAWWVWRQACGDPHVVGYPGASGSLNPTECPSGRQLPLVAGYTDVLRRAYPRYAPGRLAAVRSDWRSGRWTVRGRDGDARGSCRAEVWVPDTGRGAPAVRASSVGAVTVHRRAGGWLVTGCARGSYALTGAPAGRWEAPPPQRDRACRTRRRIVVRLKRARRARRITVRTSGAKVRRVRVQRRRGRIVLVLRRSVRGRLVVRVRGRTRSGRRFAARRAYRVCGTRARRHSAARH